MNKPPESAAVPATVFKDKGKRAPVSSADTVGYMMLGRTVTLVVLMRGLWIPAALVGHPSLARIIG